MTQISKDKKKKISISVKWTFFICLSVLLAIGVTVISNNYTVGKILKSDNETNSTRDVQNVAEQIYSNVNTYKVSIEQFAQLTSVDLQNRKGIQKIQQNVADLQKNNANYLAVYYMDFLTGKLHIAPTMDYSSDVRETRTYKQLVENPKTQWMDVYKDQNQNKMMTSIVTPVFVHNKMVGALGYDIDLSSIGTIRQNIEKNSSSKLAILDTEGLIVSSFIAGADGKNMDPTKSGTVKGIDDILTNSKDFKDTFGWINKLYKTKSEYSHTLTLDGKAYSGKAMTVPELNWKVLSLTPVSDFQAKMNKLNLTAIFSALLGLVIGLLAATFLAKRLKKIIVDFQHVIEKTAKGDLTAEMSIHSRDEIEELAQYYNKMLANMRTLIEKVSGNANTIQLATSDLETITLENNEGIANVSK